VDKNGRRERGSTDKEKPENLRLIAAQCGLGARGIVESFVSGSLIKKEHKRLSLCFY
jgi:hypothetical protein